MQGLLKDASMAAAAPAPSPMQQGQAGGQVPAPAPNAPGMGNPGMGNGGNPGGASPEEQEMYDIVVGQTTEQIYGPGLESIKQRIQEGAEDGVEDDVGAIVGQLLAMNYQSAAEQGRAIPPQVIAGAAKELTEVVTDIAVEMQLIPQQEADDAADDALYVSMATFGKAVPNLPPEEKQIYAQMLQELEVAEVQAKTGMQGGQPAGAMP